MNRMFVLIGFVVIAAIGGQFIFSEHVLAAPTSTSIIVLPHPDDEMETWSLVENSTSNYKVFVYMTHGEQTGYCADYSHSQQTQYGEIAPTPTPGSTWSTECANARMDSTINFLNKMSLSDASLPHNLTYDKTLTMPSDGTPVAHCDAMNEANCVVDQDVRVYDGGANGKVLFFNLGDGDLNKAEVTWAIHAVINNRSELGIPTTYPVYNLIGDFYSSGKYANCHAYTHPDHYAIHQALYSVDFQPTGYQTAATCKSDPDVARTKDVSQAAWNTAFAVNTTTHQRTGWFQKYYGWLDAALNGWPNDASVTTQAQTFMRHQSFWQRF